MTRAGFTGLGTPDSLRRLVASGHFDTMQVPYSLLNRTAGEAAEPGWVEEDHGGLMNDCHAAG